MSRKGKRGSTADFAYGEWPFLDGVPSADAADAARYRYLMRGDRFHAFVISGYEGKEKCDAIIDAAIENAKAAT